MLPMGSVSSSFPKVPTPKTTGLGSYVSPGSVLLKTYFRYLNGVIDCLPSILQKMFGRIHVLRLPESHCKHSSWLCSVSLLLYNIPRSAIKTSRHQADVCGLLLPIKKKCWSNCHMVFSNSSWGFPKRKASGLCVRLAETTT